MSYEAEQSSKLEKRLEQAADEIIALRKRLEELDTIAKFWRQAAEHAIAGWNDLEERYESKLEKLQNIEAMLSLVIGDDRPEYAPPDPLGDPRTLELHGETMDLGDGIKLTIVEDETPIG